MSIEGTNGWDANALSGLINGEDGEIGVWDVLTTLMWTNLFRQIGDNGSKISVSSYDVEEAVLSPFDKLIYIPVEIGDYNWLRVVLTEFEDKYYFTNPYIELSIEKKNPFEGYVPDSLYD